VLGVKYWIFGVAAMMMAGSAQAQDSVPHATLGAWQVAAEPQRGLCKMSRYYGSTKDKHVEGLVIRYHAAKETAWLSWSTDAPTIFTSDGQIDLHLSFVTPKGIDDSWGSRTFRHGQPEDIRYFVNGFTGAKDSQRFLRDLAVNRLIGLDLGPVLLTALSLDAGPAVASLRECAAKVAAVSAPAQ
jgi:hypothetical protein